MSAQVTRPPPEHVNDKSLGIDPFNGRRGFDPSDNVKALTEAANQRQDDLRDANEKLMTERILRIENAVAHTEQLASLRDQHAREMRVSEAARLDSIRQVDVTAVRTEATRALEAIQTLAATSARDAETLRVLVTNTAANLGTQTADTVKQITERLAALERSSYEGVGKQRLADPMQEKLLAEVQRLSESRVSVTARGAGQTALTNLIFGLIAAGAAVVAVISFLQP